MLNEHDESAFPVQVGNTIDDLRGMSLLDWFAGQALASFNWIDSEVTFARDAQRCFDMAEAMMDERKRRNDEQK